MTGGDQEPHGGGLITQSEYIDSFLVALQLYRQGDRKCPGKPAEIIRDSGLVI